MSNKIQLQLYNNELSDLITRIEVAKNIVASLPEAGGNEPGSGAPGGSGLETVTITFDATPEPGSIVYYLDSTFSLREKDVTPGMSFTVIKSSILVISGLMGRTLPSCVYLVGNTTCSAYLVTG